MIGLAGSGPVLPLDHSSIPAAVTMLVIGLAGVIAPCRLPPGSQRLREREGQRPQRRSRRGGQAHAKRPAATAKQQPRRANPDTIEQQVRTLQAHCKTVASANGGQREELPEGLDDDVMVVGTGAEFLGDIESH